MTDSPDDLRQEFESCFAQDGGIATADFVAGFPHGADVNEARILAQELARSIADGLAAKGVQHLLYFDLLNSPTLNAIAFNPRPGVSFVGVNLGTLLRTRILLEILISQAHYPDRRVADEDTVRRVLLHDAPEDAQWQFLREVGNRAVVTDGYPFLPALARIQWAFALDFIIAHEMNHAMLGHTDFAARHLRLERIRQDEVLAEDDLQDEKRLLELRADYAAGRAIGVRLPNQKYLVFPAPGADQLLIDEFMGNAAFALAALLIGFNISWRLDPTRKLFGVHEHPHPNFRYRMASDGVLAGLRTHPGHDLDETWFNQSVHHGSAHCKNAYRALMGDAVEFSLEPGPVYYIPRKGSPGPHPHVFSTDAEAMYAKLYESMRTLDERTGIVAYIE